MKPLATSKPKAFTEHALNQGMAGSLLEKTFWTEKMMMFEEDLNNTVSCCI